jgi:single-strand DNA-binding protein
MHGIHAAFRGKLGADAELRHSKGGKPWISIPVVVSTSDGEAERSTWVRVAIFGDKAESLASRLTKGTEVYAEGRLSLNAWTGKEEGEVKTGLSLAAWEVQPMGRIGHKKPRTG